MSGARPTYRGVEVARWLAAFAVLGFHARHLLFSAAPASGLGGKAFFAATSFGDEAVAVFFAISGFLVGGSAIRALRVSRFTVRPYLLARFRRIYVVLIPALALTAIVDLIRGAWEADYPALLACNALNLQNNLCATPPGNGALWSLACEWFYYLSLPVLFVVWKRRGWWLLALLPMAAYSAHFGRVGLYGHLIWMAGAGAAFLPLGRWVYLPALAGLVAQQVFLRDTQEGFALVGLCAAVALCAERRTERAPDAHTALSGFSYSLYAIHEPLLLLVAGVVTFGAVTAPSVAQAATIMLVIAAFAAVFSLCTENLAAPRRWLANLPVRAV